MFSGRVSLTNNGVLYGGELNHGYDYIINNTNLGVEHYFNVTVFDKLHFEGGK